MAAEIGKRNRPVQTSGTSSPVGVAQYSDQAEVKAEPTLPTDPAAKQRAVDTELNRAIKQAVDVELNRAIARALSDASKDDLKHHSDQ